MIPEFQRPALRISQLDDTLMTQVLENAEYGDFNIDVAREATYQYLRLNSVSDDAFNAFETELRRVGMITGEDVNIMFFIELLAAYVSDYRNGIMLRQYADNLDLNKVKRVTYDKLHTDAIPSEDIATMFGILAVCGRKDETLTLFLERYSMSIEDIIDIAEAYPT